MLIGFVALVVNIKVKEVVEVDNKIFGYARVSSKDQNLDRQLDSLKKYVADERNIIVDKVSGKDTNRPGLSTLLFSVRAGDTIYIHSLDRLGRNKEDIKTLLTEFKNRKVIVRILDLPTSMVDYGEAGNSIMELINNILIEVLSFQAQAEREQIRKRQQEGIASAKARGVRFGREKYELPETWSEDYQNWKSGKCTAKSIMKKYGWASTTFYRKVMEYEKQIM